MQLIDYKNLSEQIERAADCGVRIYDLKTQDYWATPGFWKLIGEPQIDANYSSDYLERVVDPSDLLEYRRASGVVNIHLKYPVSSKFRIITRDKTSKYLSNRSELIIDRSGEILGIISIYKDVTEEFATKTHIRRMEELQADLVSHANAISWTITPSGSQFDSVSWCTLTGQSFEAAQGSGWLSAIHPDDRAVIATGWTKAQAGRCAFTERFRIKCLDGTYRWFVARSAPTFHRDGSIKEWVGAGIDIEDLSPSTEGEAGIPPKVSGPLIRAARGLLNWSSRELAEAAELTPAVLRTIEEARSNLSSDPKIARIMSVLKQNGVSFALQPNGKTGLVI